MKPTKIFALLGMILSLIVGSNMIIADYPQDRFESVILGAVMLSFILCSVTLLGISRRRTIGVILVLSAFTASLHSQTTWQQIAWNYLTDVPQTPSCEQFQKFASPMGEECERPLILIGSCVGNTFIHAEVPIWQSPDSASCEDLVIFKTWDEAYYKYTSKQLAENLYQKRYYMESGAWWLMLVKVIDGQESIVNAYYFEADPVMEWNAEEQRVPCFWPKYVFKTCYDCD